MNTLVEGCAVQPLMGALAPPPPPPELIPGGAAFQPLTETPALLYLNNNNQSLWKQRAEPFNGFVQPPPLGSSLPRTDPAAMADTRGPAAPSFPAPSPLQQEKGVSFHLYPLHSYASPGPSICSPTPLPPPQASAAVGPPPPPRPSRLPHRNC